MADFETAAHITGINEGLYSNDKSDKGKETVFGISRVYWPNWNGWKTIDAIKAAHGIIPSVINEFIKKDPLLPTMRDQFYKQNFWDVNKLGQLNDQQLANSIYDFGVNAGVATAAKMLQRCAGVTADGIIGSGTLQAINSANAENLYNAFNAARKSYYEAIIARDPSQKVFEHSWLSRLKPYIK